MHTLHTVCDPFSFLSPCERKSGLYHGWSFSHMSYLVNQKLKLVKSQQYLMHQGLGHLEQLVGHSNQCGSWSSKGVIFIRVRTITANMKIKGFAIIIERLCDMAGSSSSWSLVRDIGNPCLNVTITGSLITLRSLCTHCTSWLCRWIGPLV